MGPEHAGIMFRTLLRRYGIATITFGMTMISILLFVGITLTINGILVGGPLGEGFIITIVAPLVIAPLMSWQIPGLLVKLDVAERQMQLLSHTDELTQTHNRCYFMQHADQELKRFQRSGEKFSIAILDLEYLVFKEGCTCNFCYASRVRIPSERPDT